MPVTATTFTQTMLSSIHFGEIINTYLQVLAVGLAFLTVAVLGILFLKYVLKANVNRLKEFFYDDGNVFSMSRLSIFMLLYYVLSNGTYITMQLAQAKQWTLLGIYDIPWSIATILIGLYGINTDQISHVAEVLSRFRGNKDQH